MSLIAEAMAPTLVNHVLIPVVFKVNRVNQNMGWCCRDCGQYWWELPPVADRLNACSADIR